MSKLHGTQRLKFRSEYFCFENFFKKVFRKSIHRRDSFGHVPKKV